jgi:hypothetical protein
MQHQPAFLDFVEAYLAEIVGIRTTASGLRPVARQWRQREDVKKDKGN